MPNFSGVWTLQEQFEAITEGNWTGIELFELYSWGDNGFGQLGQNTSITLDRSSPVQVGSLTTWDKVAGGLGLHSAAIKSDGTLWMWGYNGFGELGDNTIIRKSSPVQVGALTNWSQVSTGVFHTTAVKTDGTLWSWGSNTSGRLGDGTVVSKSSPVQIGTLTTWSQVSSGNLHSAAIKTDGTIWSWGAASFGRLGNNTTGSLDQSSPIQIGALTNWSQVDAGNAHSVSVTTDGKIYAWGIATWGCLGDNVVVNRSSPVQVGALTTWSQLATGNAHSIAVKTDGTLWGWGLNNKGQLADNTVVGRSSPVQIGSETNWSKAFCGDYHSGAIDTDSRLYMWGEGDNGRLGTDDTVDRSSPVQIGTGSWLDVGLASNQTVGIFKARTGMS